MGPRMILIGRRSGRLTVIGYSSKRTGGNIHWKCRCLCGNTVDVAYNNIKLKIARSCGCLRREVTARRNRTHGRSRTRTYHIWVGMKQRCTNPDDASYIHYGRRGIHICRRWMRFENFRSDMGEAPPKLSLDRVNNDKGYAPSNCRWATAAVQRRNSRRVVMIRHRGLTLCVADWADRLKVSRWKLYGRLRSGWTPQDALAL